MAKMTGLRNGYLDGNAYQIPKGSNIRDAIMAVLAECGFTKYIISINSDDYQVTQNDITVDAGNTYYEILQQLNEFNMNYQMYFDVDGIFHFNHIPSGKDAPVMVDDDIWRYAYISHEVTTNYEDLKNDIVVLGKTHTASKYSSDCALNNHTFTMSSASVKREKNHIKLAFTTPENMTPTVDGEQYYLNLNNYGSYPLRTTLGSLHFKMLPNTYYVVRLQNFGRESLSLIGAQNTTTYTLKKALPLDDMGVTASDIVGWYVSALAKSLNEAITENAKIVSYNEQNLTITLSKSINTDKAWTGRLCYMYNPNTTSTYWQFMGENQPRAEIKDENPNSPFYVNGSVGDIRIVLSGGDYDNISTNELAMERAQYELYTRCRLNDNLSLTCLPIYWLDVNWLVNITLPTENEVKPFIIKEISISSGTTATQSVTLVSYYDFYPN
jgi:hypothetical protein